MSYNQSFYNNVSGNFTFRGGNRPPFFSPPPPAPPPYCPPPIGRLELSDQEFVKTFEPRVVVKTNVNTPSTSINQVRDLLKQLILTLEDIKNDENKLKSEIGTLSDEEWNAMMIEVEKKKVRAGKALQNINNSQLEVIQKHLAKRTAKRLRLKRLRLERKVEKEERSKQLQERSRKIDENLQKIKDNILKTKQEEEMKFHMDMILKEVSKNKHDAKKCLSKLDALVRLRRARLNTAKGSGATTSDHDTEAFNQKIENLKSLWVKKLAVYENDEQELLVKFKKNKDENSGADEKEKEVANNLTKWQKILFGAKHLIPQADFGGDLSKFIGVRTQWDQYIHSEGSTIPVGWVMSPNKAVL